MALMVPKQVQYLGTAVISRDMDIIQPQVFWIGKRCYRRNPTLSEDEFKDKNEDEMWRPQGNYAEEDDFNLETCDTDVPIKKLDDGRFRVSMSIPSEFFPRIIGKSGENKSQIEKETRTQISVPKKGQSGDVVLTGCDHKGVAAAYSQISLLVATIRKRYPFTHFVSIPLQSSEVKTGFLHFQEDILNLFKRSPDIDRQLFQNPSKLHLTIGTLVLLNDNERKKAAEVLLSCRDGLRNILGPGKLEIDIRGVEYMNDDPESVDVLYGKCIDPTNRLQRVADFLLETFVNSGLMERQYDRVKVHATLMNTLFKMESDDGPRPTFNARRILEEFRDYSFGKQRIEEVHLSQRHSASKNTGYYVATSQIKLDE